MGAIAAHVISLSILGIMMIITVYEPVLFNVKQPKTQNCDATGQCDIKATPTDVVLPKGANTEGRPIDVVVGQCDDRHQDKCSTYKQQGECEKNPGWMIVNCPKSCNACHLLDPKVRCQRARLNISDPGYAPGEMNGVFEKLERKFGDRYGVTVLSTDPWIVTFDNFLSKQETDALISTVDGNWERSTDTGSVNAFGETGRVLSQGRTSSNAWCRDKCERHPDVKSITKKIEEVIEIDRSNFESFQVLRYETNQRYQAHHDMSPAQNRLACGPRILTFFLYLSDVEEGGETAFPSLGISVKPKKGKALLWPSTLDSDLEAMDGRTTHEAKPVIKGKKFAANTWIHLYDFQRANLWGCTGTFDVL